MFKHLKAGDTVFVVRQNRRRENIDLGRVLVVHKVGKKYGYIKLTSYSDLSPFFLENGVSAHPSDSNARANRHGFDVYLSEGAYQEKVRADEEFDRLQSRISWSNSLKQLPPTVVSAIHKILDEEGLYAD